MTTWKPIPFYEIEKSQIQYFEGFFCEYFSTLCSLSSWEESMYKTSGGKESRLLDISRSTLGQLREDLSKPLDFQHLPKLNFSNFEVCSLLYQTEA